MSMSATGAPDPRRAEVLTLQKGHEIMTMQQIDEAGFDALDCNLWIDADEAGRMWAGTRNWCVQQASASRAEGAVAKIVASIVEGLADAAVLHPDVIGGGAELHVNVLGTLHRLYLRPDGVRVILSDAYMTAIEAMISVEDEFGEHPPAPPAYRLCQVGGRYRPVAFVGQDNDVMAIVMPVKARWVDDA